MSDIKLQHWTCQHSLQSKSRVFRKFWLHGRCLKGNDVRITKLTSPRPPSFHLVSSLWMLEFGCNPPHTVRSLLVLISEVMSSFGQLLMPPLCGFFDCGCFSGDLKSWSPVAFKSPRYFSLLWVIFPLVDTIWPHLSSLNCCRSCCPGLLYLDRMFESWSVCGWLSQNRSIGYIYYLYYIYILLILAGLDLHAACFVLIAWFYWGR